MKRRGIRSISLIGLAWSILLSVGSALAGLPPLPVRSFLSIALLKTQTRIDQIKADIEEAEGDLQTNARVLREAEGRLAIALQTRGNRAASLVPETDLQRARGDRRRIKRILSRLESDRATAANVYAGVRSALVAGDSQGPASRTIGMVSASSGKPRIMKADGREIPAEKDRPTFLGPGDVISTGGAGRAEVLFLAGRGLIQMEGRSRIKVEEPSPQEQVLELLQGRIQVAIDRPADLERALRDRFEGPDDDLSGLLEEYRGLAAPDFARLFGMDFLMRIPGAVWLAGGMRFSAEVRADGTAEIRALEGPIEIRGLTGGKAMSIDEGSGVVVTRGGVSPLRSVKR